MLLGAEGKIVFDSASNRACSNVYGGVGGESDSNVAGVGGELVVTIIGEHAGVRDGSIGGVHFDIGTADVFQYDGTRDGTDLDVAISDISHGDCALKGAEVDVTIADIMDVDVSEIAVGIDITVQFFDRDRSSR